MSTNNEEDTLLVQYRAREKILEKQQNDRGYLKKEIRSYEVSLWTLQDDFMTVLKWSDVEQKGRIENPKMTLNVDGTQKLSFSIPMYCRVNGELVENPNWYNTQNGNLITDLRKIKVIFNKNEITDFGTNINNENASSHIFEFIIINVKENHENDILTCSIECEGLAFQELGKIGYKINLSQDNFELIHEDWTKKGKWLDHNNIEQSTEPIQNLDYWCYECGLEKYNASALLNPKQWYFDIRMNWNSFNNVASNRRDSSKLYEEPYATSWNTTTLLPQVIESYREKARTVKVEKSNLYNATQTIAETFEIFCQYQYLYDENYHIIGRVIVFYNNFFQEESKGLSFQYPYTLARVERSMDSTNLTTKLFILDPDDNVVVMNADANDMREDYILNFDYLYQMGGITKEQYDEIQPYKIKMRQFNDIIIDLQEKISSYQVQLPELKAKQTVYKNSIDLDKEQIAQNNALLQTLAEKYGNGEPGSTMISLTAGNADNFILLTNENKSKYINLKNTNKGIDRDTIRIYTTFHSSEAGPMLTHEITDYEFEDDDYNNLTGVVFTNENQFINSQDIDWATLFQLYYVPIGYAGNVDLSQRMIVPASSFISAGYDDFDGTYGTLFSSTYTATYRENDNDISLAGDKRIYDIVFTPVLEDGTVLSSQQIEQYLEEVVVNGGSPNDWMAADKQDKESGIKNLFLGYFDITDAVNTEVDGETEEQREERIHKSSDDWASDLHNKQEEWDRIRATNDWFGYTEFNPSNIVINPLTDYNHLSCCTSAQVAKYTKNTVATRVYLTYDYDPKLYYQKIVETWQHKLADDLTNYKDLTKQIGPTSLTDTDYDLSVYEVGTTLETAYNNGINKLLNDAIDTSARKINEKNLAIKAFEHIMGPAIREGYWQPENYTDYGDKHEYDSNITTDNIAASTDDVIIAWDEKLFDDEDKLYYEEGAERKKVYYPCIDLLAVFNNNIPEDLEDYSIVWKAAVMGTYDWTSIKDLQTLSVGSKALIKFIKQNDTIKPVLVVIGAKSFAEVELERLTGANGEARLEKYTTSVDENGILSVSHGDNQYPIGNHWIITDENTSEANIPKMEYPRIKFLSQALKTNEKDLVIRYNDLPLTQFKDYRINTRNTLRNEQYYPEYYVTIKPESLIKHGYTVNKQFHINYVLSNANTAIYLDAIKVSKENAYPKVAYEVAVTALNTGILRQLYTQLARIVMINDTELKFQDVFGYVSGMELDLDNCANDTLEIKNYKTKFEDLFSTIVASTEEMKRSGAGLTTALSGGIPLSEEGLTQTLLNNQDIFQAYIDSGVDSSKVVTDKIGEIFTDASKALVHAKQSLDKLHSLTLKNADILSGFIENISEGLAVNIFDGPTRPQNFNSGDIWLRTCYDENGNPYIKRMVATSNSADIEGLTDSSGFTATYDGSLASIRSALVDYDANAGLVTIYGENNIDIRSGSSLYIAANDHISIVGNKTVNIGGSKINIVADATNSSWDTGITMKSIGPSNNTINIPIKEIWSEILDKRNLAIVDPADDAGFKTAVDSHLIIENDNTQAIFKHFTDKSIVYMLEKSTILGTNEKVDYGKVYNELIGKTSIQAYIELKPTKIELSAAELALKAASSINLYSSQGNAGTTSALHISSKDGIYMGTGTSNGIRLFSGSFSFDENGEIDQSIVDGASVELNDKHLLLGFDNISHNNANVIEVTEDYVVIAAGGQDATSTWEQNHAYLKGMIVYNNEKYYRCKTNHTSTTTWDNSKWTELDSPLLDLSGGLIGAEFNKSSINLATQSQGTINAFVINHRGISMATDGGLFDLANATDQEIKDYFNRDSNTTGSFLRVAPTGIEFGSLADLYINTDNFKLQTHSRDKAENNQNFIDGETVMAVGSNLQSIGYETKYNPTTEKWTEPDSNGDYQEITFSNGQPDVRLLVNKNGVYVKGNVYATAFQATTSNGYFKATGTNLGFYDSNNNPILTINNNAEITASKKLSISADDLYIGNSKYSDISQSISNNYIVESIKMYRIWKSSSQQVVDNINIIEGNNTSTVNSNWQEQIPTPTNDYPYIWSVTRFKKGDGTYSYSTPVYDANLTNSQATTYYKFTRTNSTTAPAITNLNDLNNNWYLEVPIATIEGTSSSTAAATLPYVWRTLVTIKLGQTTTWSTPERVEDYEGISNAAINAINVANGYTSVPYVDATGIVIQNGNINISAQASITLASNTALNFTTSSGNNAMIFNNDGISIGTAKSIGLAAGGTIDIVTDNLILKSNATGANSIFELKKQASDWTAQNNHYDTAMKYSITNGLQVTGTIYANAGIIGSDGDYPVYTHTDDKKYYAWDHKDKYYGWVIEPGIFRSIHMFKDADAQTITGIPDEVGHGTDDVLFSEARIYSDPSKAGDTKPNAWSMGTYTCRSYDRDSDPNHPERFFINNVYFDYAKGINTATGDEYIINYSFFTHGGCLVSNHASLRRLYFDKGGAPEEEIDMSVLIDVIKNWEFVKAQSGVDAAAQTNPTPGGDINNYTYTQGSVSIMGDWTGDKSINTTINFSSAASSPSYNIICELAWTKDDTIFNQNASYDVRYKDTSNIWRKLSLNNNSVTYELGTKKITFTMPFVVNQTIDTVGIKITGNFTRRSSSDDTLTLNVISINNKT